MNITVMFGFGCFLLGGAMLTVCFFANWLMTRSR
jgi:hypothetical protein